MSQLFGVEENTITYHIQEIFKYGELDENPTTRKIRVVRNEGKQKAEEKAMEEYSKFRSLQDKNFESDFERMIKEIDSQNKE